MTDYPQRSPLITDVEVAREVNRLLFPETDRINKRIDDRRAFWIAQMGLDAEPLTAGDQAKLDILLRTVDAGLLFLANMEARYGSHGDDFDWDAYHGLDDRLQAAGHSQFPRSMKKKYLPYHQAEHLIWIMDRLIEIYKRFSFPFERCCVVTMSVGPHDLEQLLPGARADGVGWNECVSADEARELMLGAGFDSELHGNMIDRVRTNIHGTTFSFDEGAGFVGAMAPTLVDRLRKKYPHPDQESKVDEEIQDLLLTADVDTSSVTDFTEYTQTAVLLCRENLVARQQAEVCAPVPALNFLTKAQTRFWELQNFNSRYAQKLLQPRKERNAPLVAELVVEMEREFRADGDSVVDRQGTRIDDGEVIMQAFLAMAGDIGSGYRQTPGA